MSLLLIVLIVLLILAVTGGGWGYGWQPHPLGRPEQRSGGSGFAQHLSG
jgi:hypothetical protein